MNGETLGATIGLTIVGSAICLAVFPHPQWLEIVFGLLVGLIVLTVLVWIGVDWLKQRFSSSSGSD